jgi:hypothetical protein
MVVDNLNVKRIGVKPAKADAPLVVDPNTMLPSPIACQGFQMIARNRTQVRQGRRRVNLVQLTFRHGSNSLKLPAKLAPENPLGLFISEGPNHNFDHTTAVRLTQYVTLRRRSFVEFT